MLNTSGGARKFAKPWQSSHRKVCLYNVIERQNFASEHLPKVERKKVFVKMKKESALKH